MSKNVLLQTYKNFNITTNENLQSNKGYQNNLLIVSALQMKHEKKILSENWFNIHQMLFFRTVMKSFH